VRLLVATEEQRYGPRWLRDDDEGDKTGLKSRNLLRPNLS